MKNLLAKTLKVSAILATALLIPIESCNYKEEITIGPNEKIEPRSLTNQEIDWLSDFQGYLYKLRNNQSVTNVYTLQEAVYGVEALLNIRYGESVTGILDGVISDTFNISTSSNWYTLFANSYSGATDILDELTINQHLEAFDVEIRNVADGIAQIITRAIIKNDSEENLEKYHSQEPINCETEIFGDEEAYFLWLGGTDQQGLFSTEKIDCNTECGSTDPGQTAVLEEIASHINASYPEPTCEAGRIWTHKYTNVNFDYDFMEWHEGYFDDCTYFEEQEFYACDCMNSQLLNCMQCIIYGHIDVTGHPITIPSGYHFMNIDLGVDYIDIPPYETTHTRIDIKYFYGKPVCVWNVFSFTEDILTMDLSEMKCC